jgi:hypothetical protein
MTRAISDHGVVLELLEDLAHRQPLPHAGATGDDMAVDEP